MAINNSLFYTIQKKFPKISIGDFVKITVSSYQECASVCQPTTWGDPIGTIQMNPKTAWFTLRESKQAYFRVDISRILNFNWYSIVGYKLSVFNTCNYPVGWSFKGRKDDDDEWKEIANVDDAKSIVSSGTVVSFKTKKTIFNQYMINITKTSYSTMYTGIKSFDLLYKFTPRSLVANKQCTTGLHIFFVLLII